MKKFLWFFMLVAGIVFAACSDDSEAYDADSAVSNYVPLLGSRQVASLFTTNEIDGREYSWKHNFTYDKHGRIKEVNSEIKHHRAFPQVLGGVNYQLCNIISNAKYYYKGEYLQIAYTVNREYPNYSEYNNSYSYVDAAMLNENGHIKNYSQPPYEGFECEYNFAKLRSVAFDGGHQIDIYRDAKNNVNGHKYTGYDKNGNDSISTLPDRYKYTGVRNKTNFDFSAYLGYWEHERCINAMLDWPYASYQLAAFGFFGTGSEFLPLCLTSLAADVATLDLWVFDNEGFPVKYTDPSGRVTEITYTE